MSHCSILALLGLRVEDRIPAGVPGYRRTPVPQGAQDPDISAFYTVALSSGVRGEQCFGPRQIV